MLILYGAESFEILSQVILLQALVDATNKNLVFPNIVAYKHFFKQKKQIFKLILFDK